MNTTELTALVAKLTSMVKPLMIAYQQDLDTDIELIVYNRDIPFLHWTRKTGTDIAMLYPPDHVRFPAKGQRIEYLFGLCNREEFAHHPLDQAQYWTHAETELVLHFDGKSLHRITPQRAVDLAIAYFHSTVKAWSRTFKDQSNGITYRYEPAVGVPCAVTPQPKD